MIHKQLIRINIILKAVTADIFVDSSLAATFFSNEATAHTDGHLLMYHSVAMAIRVFKEPIWAATWARLGGKTHVPALTMLFDYRTEDSYERTWDTSQCDSSVAV